jgi:hypothetical protein
VRGEEGMQASSKMRARHVLDKHRHRCFTGIQDRITKMMPIDGKVAVTGVLVAEAALGYWWWRRHDNTRARQQTNPWRLPSFFLSWKEITLLFCK